MAKRDSTTVETQDPTPPPHEAMEEIIEDARTQLMTARSLLNCAATAINNQPMRGNDDFIYADVMEVASTIITGTTERLDSANLRAFYDLLERGYGGTALAESSPHNLTFRICGHAQPLLSADARVTACGDICDGVRLALHGGRLGPSWQEDARDCWVMAFADLEALYRSARALRVGAG